MDYNYLVPANSKKQGLVFGFMDKLDLIILGTGLLITFILLMILPVKEVWGMVLTLLPAGISAFLVFPIANYHNSRVFFYEMYKFYFVNRRKYIWRGWCYQYEQSDDE